jgi:deoxyribodipyrimidine photo-lyase
VAIVWLRRALRLADNPALAAALAEADAVVPVYVHAPESAGTWRPGTAALGWLARSLGALDAAAAERGSRLVVRTGPPADALAALAAECGASVVHFDRRYEPAAAETDARVRAALESGGVAARTHNCSLLVEPDALTKASGGPHRVFSAYYRAWLGLQAGAPGSAASSGPPLPAPARIPAPPVVPHGLDPAAVGRDSAGVPADPGAYWRPGEAGAQSLLARFLDEAVAHYEEGRDRPDWFGTSRLSPHLAFGEIGPRQVAHELSARVGHDGADESAAGGRAFLRQLAWREYAYHLLHHFPHTQDRPLRPAFEDFPWSEDAASMEAWRTGRTGYPIVDAGMRELLATGWMHNRVRMVVASFLTKDLLIPWQSGARWFWERLVDADLANNTLGWQWVAGCGADAAPYFRVFNPALQGEKHDPDGAYVRSWVPELAALPSRWIHRPWQAPAEALSAAGVTLGRTYPAPVVDHAEARRRALAAYAAVAGRGA